MIMKRMFNIFWKCGMILIATSNRNPQDLYYNGIQRDLFLPFIDNLVENNIIYNVESETDYREKMILAEMNQKYSKEEKLKIFYHPFNSDNFKKFDEMFLKYTGNRKALETTINVVEGRLIKGRGVGRIGRFDFNYLFNNDLGASDFIAICKKYVFIFIENFEEVDVSNKNMTRRIILFIDEIYNHRVKLFAYSALDIQDLFKIHRDSESEEAFMIKRCVSRLSEIQTLKYFNQKHQKELIK